MEKEHSDHRKTNLFEIKKKHIMATLNKLNVAKEENSSYI